MLIYEIGQHYSKMYCFTWDLCCSTHIQPSYTFSLTFSLRCSIDFMRKYTINRRTVKEVVNNNNAVKVSHFIHVLPKLKIGTHTIEKKITKCKCTTVPIKFNKLISEIQVLCWPINHSFLWQQKNIG